MVIHVFSWARSHRSAALVVLGWVAFVLGLLASPVWARLMLLTASRVLPQAAPSHHPIDRRTSRLAAPCGRAPIFAAAQETAR